MREHGFRRLPVVDADGTIRGVISLADIAPYVRELVDGVLEEVAAYRHVV